MNANYPKNLKVQVLFSFFITFIGFILLLFMIVVESEPGAVPLALIIIGTTWFFYTRSIRYPKQNSD